MHSRTIASTASATGRAPATVHKRQEIHRINLENDRLAHAILSKKSEFSRKQMDKDWWQKVLPVKRFMKNSRRPFKVESSTGYGCLQELNTRFNDQNNSIHENIILN